MKKKVIEGARKLIKKLFEAILDREAFIFEAPKAFTRNFSRDMLTDDQLEVIDSWKAAVRGQLNTAEKLHADKRGLADHGDTYFEMLPLPAPNIIVMCDKCLIRYEIEVFAYKKGVLLSAVQAAVSENGVGIAGINLSGKERALVQTARQLTALDFLKNPIYVDRMSQWRDQLSSNTRFLVPPSMEQVTAALRETPIAVVWAMHTAVLASLMPLLEDDAKPFFTQLCGSARTRQRLKCSVICSVMFSVVLLSAAVMGRAPSASLRFRSRRKRTSRPWRR